MDKYEIVQRIENFAPLETQEKWDCSGWLVETPKKNINKIMLCLTVTDSIGKQAETENCDMIVSHHPLFSVPLEFKNIDIYCAHTNLDIAECGTTDILIKSLGLTIDYSVGFLRFSNYKTSVKNFISKLKEISPNLRLVNNSEIENLEKIAFCAGSGSEFIKEAYENGAQALVTGDIKFHTALESPIVLFDIGHFESEIIALPIFEKLINNDCEVVYANEKNPFKIP